MTGMTPPARPQSKKDAGDGADRLAAPPAAGVLTRRHQGRLDGAGRWVLAAYAVASWPIILFGIDAHRWFWGDDWYFLAGNGPVPPNAYFHPSTSHWSTVSVVVFRVLWHVVGLRSYTPYLAVGVTLHVIAVVLLGVVMRRAGVRPWLATTTAAIFALFGPGRTDIVWAFQMGFIGPIVLGITQMLLADHDGGLDGRDALGIASGLIGLMFSSVGTIAVGAVAIALLVRRGWRVALVHVAAPVAAYIAYSTVEHPDLTPVGRPSVAVLWRWLRAGTSGTFVAIGHFAIVGAVLAAILVAGFAVMLVSDRESLRRAGLPIGLLSGAFLFDISTCIGRWELGPSAAEASRYVYVMAAFSLPAIAVAAEAIVSRWRALSPAALVVLLVPIPWNAVDFSQRYFANYERVITTVANVPFATAVPPNTRPVNDPFLADVTIGFLLRTKTEGRLPPVRRPIPTIDVNEAKVRLGVAQARDQARPSACRFVRTPLDVTPALGTTYKINSKVAIWTRDASRVTSRPVVYSPTVGHTLTVQLPNLALRLGPAPGRPVFQLCT